MRCVGLQTAILNTSPVKLCDANWINSNPKQSVWGLLGSNLIKNSIQQEMTTMTKPFSGSEQAWQVELESNRMVPMRDGTGLATDIYLPAFDGSAAPGPFPVLLERTPYDKSAPENAEMGLYFARRGYVCAIQDVRGRFESEGLWYPFAKEAPDGFDSVEWLSGQPWCDGQVGTMGGSYCGSDQSALATLNPPSLRTMIVAVGASSYYHASMRQNGVLEQRFIVYAFRMATTSKEALADPVLRAMLLDAYANVGEWFARVPFKKGVSALRHLPTYEQWVIDILSRGDYGPYWQQRGYDIAHHYEEHADVPTLYLGGWYDSYARSTCENFSKLSKLKEAPQMLLMGPWIHGGWEETFAGDLDFGNLARINYHDLRLAWFDHFLKGLKTEFSASSPVRIFVMGPGDNTSNYYGRLQKDGYWRLESNFPLPDTQFTVWYLQEEGLLSREQPTAEVSESTYTFDPRDPVPTIGGGISAASPIMEPGGFDQRGDSRFFGCRDSLPLNARSDVLTFESAPLPADLEITGPIMVRLYVSSSVSDTDFTAKLIEVLPPSAESPDGLAINLTDSVMRTRYRISWEKPLLMQAGEVCQLDFPLYPTANVFKAGHSIRVDISSSNFPRFDVNPNTGGPLGIDRRFRLADQVVYHNCNHPSQVILPEIHR